MQHAHCAVILQSSFIFFFCFWLGGDFIFSIAPISIIFLGQFHTFLCTDTAFCFQKYCFFYLFSEDSYETCGPRRYGDPTDVPRLFIVRYKRNSTNADAKVEKITKTIWDSFQEDVDLASQLVARYNGSEDIPEVKNFTNLWFGLLLLTNLSNYVS